MAVVVEVWRRVDGVIVDADAADEAFVVELSVSGTADHPHGGLINGAGNRLAAGEPPVEIHSPVVAVTNDDGRVPLVVVNTIGRGDGDAEIGPPAEEAILQEQVCTACLAVVVGEEVALDAVIIVGAEADTQRKITLCRNDPGALVATPPTVVSAAKS